MQLGAFAPNAKLRPLVRQAGALAPRRRDKPQAAGHDCQVALTAAELAHHAVEQARQTSGRLAWSVAMKMTLNSSLTAGMVLVGGDTGSMIGEHALSAAADAVAKGVTGFDVQQIYEVGKKQLKAPTSLPACSGTEGVGGLNQRGWVAVEEGEGSVSLTLEYAYNYACLAGLAQHLGLAADATVLQARALAYQNSWDPATQFFRPRHANGSWQTPFGTESWDFDNDYYVEGAAWQ